MSKNKYATSFDWILIFRCMKMEAVNLYFNYRAPPTKYLRNHMLTRCEVCHPRHNVRSIYRTCAQCSVQYRIVICYETNLYKVFRRFKHTHRLEEDYDNLLGTDEYYKKIISKYMSMKINSPNEIYEKLLENQPEIYLNLDYELSNEKSGIRIKFPTYKQVRDTMMTNTDLVEIFDIEEIKLFYKINKENYKHGNNIPFFFGLYHEPYRANDHFRICVTTLEWLSQLVQTNQPDGGLYHVVNACKITYKSFNLVIFGRSDLAHQFHPICFMITSSIEKKDYFGFFEAIKSIACELNICLFEPTFLMSEVSLPIKLACLNAFPYATYTVCFNDMLRKLKGNLRRVNFDSRKILAVEEHLRSIRESRNSEQFSNRLLKAKSEWSRDSTMKLFLLNFEANFISSQVNWQLYVTPPGYAKTNEACKNFKSFFVHSMLPCRMITIYGAIRKIISLQDLFNKKPDIFYISPPVNSVPSYLIDRVNSIRNDQMRRLNSNTILFISSNADEGNILIKVYPPKCECSVFLEKAYCHHLIAIQLQDITGLANHMI